MLVELMYIRCNFPFSFTNKHNTKYSYRLLFVLHIRHTIGARSLDMHSKCNTYIWYDKHKNFCIFLFLFNKANQSALTQFNGNITFQFILETNRMNTGDGFDNS